MAKHFRQYITNERGVRIYWDVNWRGEEVTAEARQAAKAIAKQWGEYVRDEARATVHVITGTLQGGIELDNEPYETKTGAHQRVIAYAENDQGRDYAIFEELLHPYMQPALQKSQGQMDHIVEANAL